MRAVCIAVAVGSVLIAVELLHALHNYKLA